MTRYEVVRGSIKLPTKVPKGANKKTAVPRAAFVKKGALVTDEDFDEDEIASMVKDGRIKAVRESREQTGRVRGARKQKRGPWAVNPDSLKGKSDEELEAMVLSIDPDFDTAILQDREQAIEQLTKDFDPEFDEEADESVDDNAPGLTPDGVKTGTTRELSAQAKSKLARAQAKAKGKGEHTHDDDE